MANYQTCKSGEGSCGILNYGVGPPQSTSPPHTDPPGAPPDSRTTTPLSHQTSHPPPHSSAALVPPDRQMDQRLKQREERGVWGELGGMDGCGTGGGVAICGFGRGYCLFLGIIEVSVRASLFYLRSK